VIGIAAILGIAWLWSRGCMANYGPNEYTRASAFWTFTNFAVTVALVILAVAWVLL